MITEKSLALPAELEGESMMKARLLHRLLSIIFDREACLLPGYFVINEILKPYSDNKECEHWVSERNKRRRNLY